MFDLQPTFPSNWKHKMWSCYKSKPGLSGTFLGVQRRPERSDDTQSVGNFKRTRTCNIWDLWSVMAYRHSGPRKSLTLLETAVLHSVSGISVTRMYVRVCVSHHLGTHACTKSGEYKQWKDMIAGRVEVLTGQRKGQSLLLPRACVHEW